MAASSSKPSPSNNPVKGSHSPLAGKEATAEETTNVPEANTTSTEEEASTMDVNSAPAEVVKEEGTAQEPAPVVTLKDPPPAKQVQLPTYESSEASGYYTAAKALLNAGDFEQALTTIEQGIETTRQTLLDGLGQDDDCSGLHPCMGPFHYLYGTTLLYSIEEANDGTQAMTTTEETAKAAAAASASASSGVGAAADDDPAEMEAAAAAQLQAAPAFDADDMQIAFENLDTARLILELHIQKYVQNNDQDKKVKLQLDLAQIYLREGDLHKLNGRYEAAVNDYGQCLKYRDGVLGPYDRKIADVHYNLALTYSLAVAQATAAQQQQQSELEEQEPTAAAGAAGLKSTGEEEDEPQSPEDGKLSPEKLADYKRKSFHHYYECGKSFSGQLATLCGQDPQAMMEQVDNDIAGKKSSAGDDGLLHDLETVSAKLRTLTKFVSELQPPPEEQEFFQSLLDVIVEVQETVDESEEATKAVQEMAGLKKEITAATAAAADASEGFGSAAAAASTAAANDLGVASSSGMTTVGFGSASAEGRAATATSQPVMVVRKKKKRSAEDNAEKPPSKQPKSE